MNGQGFLIKKTKTNQILWFRHRDVRFVFPVQYTPVLPAHRWCIACLGLSSRNSRTLGCSHSGLQDQIRDSNPNSNPSAFLCSGSAPPPTGLQSQPQSPPQLPFPPAGIQTHLDGPKRLFNNAMRAFLTHMF